ncbi:MoaD/ThiS family protein [Candidatus Bathyarchaeota archaeon]|nr:MoaD/ThiS family protein [Candidatus Bathyarchaeota archaeon]
MSLKIRMLGVLREAGSKEQTIDINEGATVDSVIRDLIAQDERLETVLWDKEVDSPLPNALIMLDGVEVNNLDGLETPVKKGQELVLLSVVHGG